MPQHSEPPDWEDQRKKIIGLGESSIHKSYYPDLRRRMVELERFKTLLSQTSDAILLITFPGGICVDANNSAITMLGLSREILIKSPILPLLPQDIENAMKQQDLILSGNGEKKQMFELEISDSAGSRRPYEVSFQVVSFGHDHFVVLVARDITERLQAQNEIRLKHEELGAAYEELSATEEELRQNFQDLERSRRALELVGKKLNIWHNFTLNEIQNAMFSLSGYIDLQQGETREGCNTPYFDTQRLLIHRIQNELDYAKQYQDLGWKKPLWHNVKQVFLFAVSHLNMEDVHKTIALDDMEIYADPLIEKVFFILAENSLLHGKSSELSLRYETREGSLVLIYEDNGTGIPEEQRQTLFSPEIGIHAGKGLLLAKDILDITGIRISEVSTPAHGARFEITVPAEVFRFPNPQE